MTQTQAQDERHWDAVVARDKSFDGCFVFAVRSTGIYCRPGCPARHPLRRNVLFFATWEDAEQAGFRACLRCRPNETPAAAKQAALIARACRALDADAPPPLDRLAAEAGLSRFHFHRLFKSVTGVTPKAYEKARRGARMRAALTAAPTVTEAIYAAGYNSGSRFYESASSMLGMSPDSFRKQGDGTEITYALGTCSLGELLVARSARGICAIMLGDEGAALEREIRKRFAKAKSLSADAGLAALLARVIAFIEAPAAHFDLPLDIRGTLFQQKVWEALRAIPPGETASYTEIAERIGAPRAVRAVAQACAANKIAVAIPCHRVLRSDGHLSGYRWGVARKRALLDRERKD